jgi:DNA polymerase III alpha subunit
VLPPLPLLAGETSRSDAETRSEPIQEYRRGTEAQRQIVEGLEESGKLKQSALPRDQGADPTPRHDVDAVPSSVGAPSSARSEQGDEIDLPLFPAPTEGQDIVADYASLGLTLRRHPLALLRGHLHRRGLLPAAGVLQRAHGQRVRTGGLVITRQRPASAHDVTFITLEDETGHVNLVVWKSLAERQRAVMLGARLLGVDGEVQREGSVVHVIARRLYDHSTLLGDLAAPSRDFR